MTELLSEDQIEALVSAAREGDLPASARPAQPRARARRVREIDFSRPSKFTQEQQKRIERAHEAYCRAMTNKLTADLRMPVELEVLNVAQHVWSSALEDVPAPSVFAVVGTRPLGTSILLSVELQAMLRMIVRQLGGSTEEARIAPRELTEIEQALTRRMFGSLLGELSAVWNELLGLELDLLDLETALSGVQLAPPSDPSLVITMEARFKDASSTISLLIPHRSIASAIDSLSSGLYRDEGAEPDTATVDQLRASLADVDVEVRAEVAAVELPIEEVVALKPGDLIRFKVPAAAGVMLYADKVAIHRARPGRSENARAISVLEHVESRLMTRDQALIALGESTAEAIAIVLETLVPGGVEQGGVAVVPAGASPLASIPLPAVAARVAYVEMVTGGNIFVFTHTGAKKFAAAMMGAEASEGELSELELSAAGEAMNQMMAAAAAALGTALGTEVQISTPTTSFLTTEEDAAALFDDGAHLTTASLSVLGEPCRLVQLVPNAFVVRLTRALGDAASEAAARGGSSDAVDADSLRGVPVRVWAELGRTRLPIGRAVGLAPGTVVELDRGADEPVDLYVSQARHFGRGSLVVVDGEWAVEVIEILTPDIHIDNLEGVN